MSCSPFFRSFQTACFTRRKTRHNKDNKPQHVSCLTLKMITSQDERYISGSHTGSPRLPRYSVLEYQQLPKESPRTLQVRIFKR